MTRTERIKMQRRMQRRIRLVVEERRMAFGPRAALDETIDPEVTIEIPRAVIGRARLEQV